MPNLVTLLQIGCLQFIHSKNYYIHVHSSDFHGVKKAMDVTACTLQCWVLHLQQYVTRTTRLRFKPSFSFYSNSLKVSNRNLTDYNSIETYVRAHKLQLRQFSWCDTVGWAVASDDRGPGFKSCQPNLFYLNLELSNTLVVS